jgi:hypothetical protein
MKVADEATASQMAVIREQISELRERIAKLDQEVETEREEAEGLAEARARLEVAWPRTVYAARTLDGPARVRAWATMDRRAQEMAQLDARIQRWPHEALIRARRRERQRILLRRQLQRQEAELHWLVRGGNSTPAV